MDIGVLTVFHRFLARSIGGLHESLFEGGTGSSYLLGRALVIASEEGKMGCFFVSFIT